MPPPQFSTYREPCGKRFFKKISQNQTCSFGTNVITEHVLKSQVNIRNILWKFQVILRILFFREISGIWALSLFYYILEAMNVYRGLESIFHLFLGWEICSPLKKVVVNTPEVSDTLLSSAMWVLRVSFLFSFEKLAPFYDSMRTWQLGKQCTFSGLIHFFDRTLVFNSLGIFHQCAKNLVTNVLGIFHVTCRNIPCNV
jgi:hypothetical protein